jgi:hypothetical protein
MSAVDFSQQINLSKIESMPNMPNPYFMRDWKKVAIGYDTFVFDQDLTGKYLPLIWTDNASVNYPGSKRFGLYTVVGTTPTTSTDEAINCIPAVIGATLSGIDKSNQNGNNWVEMCQEWFNKADGLEVYENGPSSNIVDDFWYETMPNIFFYELSYLYPDNNVFKTQFPIVADKWLEVVYKMGGSTTPWKVPNMQYQGWDFSTMTPYSQHVHDEPENAGAIAWILYNAFKKTGNSKYRIGAELAMEFLNGLTSNPAYELQLSYGVYMAARMNAELGTNYDISKMLNWCFNSDNIRSWGAMLGNWGGYDVNGLIGEVNGNNNYPFVMNTFEQIGTLVPLVRYDSRFARAVGKWVLNAANAARLFYPKFLPSQNQDQPSWQWASQYDTNSYIAHEAMHQYNPNNFSVSPYASGDAENGGWGKTNLALYGSSHVGILGGIIDTTNVEGILQLNVLKTDYFHDSAYPTYLYFNPYTSDKSIEINVGTNPVDIYDAVTKTFLLKKVSGFTNLNIPANSAILAVLAPAGGVQSYIYKKFLINGVVVDYQADNTVPNNPLRIKALTPASSTILKGDTVKFYCTAVDSDTNSISYIWKSSSGSIFGSGSIVNWIAPDSACSCVISCTVKDGFGLEDSLNDTVSVLNALYYLPVINRITASPRKINIGGTSSFVCNAIDSSNYVLTYSWFSTFGNIVYHGSSATWTAPNIAGNYYIGCSVNDGHGGIVSDSLEVEVRDLSVEQTGSLRAYYPFSGNAKDASGNNNNGSVYNAELVTDRFGNPNSAYYFNGTNAYIDIPASPSLNFQNAITINFWMKVVSFNDKEQYVLSQGSYNNRLKISILPNQLLRWTIKTTNPNNSGIIDLDSETKLVADSMYNVTVDYNGSDYEIYINGYLDSFSSWSGKILQTNYDLTLGQELTSNNSYNFNGTLDEVRIYNYTLSPQQILNLYDSVATGVDFHNSLIPLENSLAQNFPNPFNPITTINFSLNKGSMISLYIYNVLGQKITTLAKGYFSAGIHTVKWNADKFSSGVYFYELKTDLQSFIKKMIIIK